MNRLAQVDSAQYLSSCFSEAEVLLLLEHARSDGSSTVVDKQSLYARMTTPRIHLSDFSAVLEFLENEGYLEVCGPLVSFLPAGVEATRQIRSEMH